MGAPASIDKAMLLHSSWMPSQGSTMVNLPDQPTHMPAVAEDLASIYYIEGEDAAQSGRHPTTCRYFQGAPAWREWMAGYEAGTFDLADFSIKP